MGNDGGSIPDRRDLVRSKPKAEQADKANQTRAKWFFCALSKRPLQEPVVSCALGKLYNKDSILEYLLDKAAFGDGEDICGHVRSSKDVQTLRLTPNTARSLSADSTTERAPFVCPLNYKEMNGSQPFVYLAPCGCVFSQAGLRAVTGTPKPNSEEGSKGAMKQKQFDVCPQCAAKYDRTEDIIMLNPSPEEEEQLRVRMETRRAAEPIKSKGKKRKVAADVGGAEQKKKRVSPLPTTNPNIAAASRAVANSLAEEEAKRKATMSEAVKSLYGPKDGSKRKETFMTMGTFTRYA